MSHSRSGVYATETVSLRVMFEDEQNNLVDPDSLPTVYIYDPSYTVDDIDAEYAASVFTGLGPFTATQIAEGYYEYEFDVPSGATTGAWHDLWIAPRDTGELHEIFAFQVVEKVSLTVQNLQNNQLVVIQLMDTITNLDGVSLGETVYLTFSTKYSPFYASPELVRSEVGPWIDFIPDDTLCLMIHWASKEVDVLTPPVWKRLHSVGVGDQHRYAETKKGKKTDMYKVARTKFCIYDAALRCLMLPAAANTANVTGGSQTKRLADLMISGANTVGFGGSGLTWDQVVELKRKREEWLRVVNAGGNIMPGQSLDPSFAIKSIADVDRRKAGRQWADNVKEFFAQPSVNGKSLPPWAKRYKFTFKG